MIASDCEFDDSEADTNLDSDNDDQLSVAGERPPVLKKAKVKLLVMGYTGTT